MFERKACHDFTRGMSGSLCSCKEERAERAFFDIYDALSILAFLLSFVMFVCFGQELAKGLKNFTSENDEQNVYLKIPFAFISNLVSDSVLVHLLSKASPSNG